MEGSTDWFGSLKRLYWLILDYLCKYSQSAFAALNKGYVKLENLSLSGYWLLYTLKAIMIVEAFIFSP